MKIRLKRLLAFVAYWSGVDSLFYWLNRRAKRIITFHNVLPDSVMEDVAKVGCMERASVFEKKIEEISRHFGFSTDLDDSKTATISFDDGMLNQYEVAGEILRRRDIPAIVFVAGNVIGVPPERTLITDRILMWMTFAPKGVVEKAFGAFASREELWVKVIQPGYREDGAHRGAAYLAKLEAIYPMAKILASVPAEWARLRLGGITREQTDELRRRGWKIGWHTKSHFPLGCLDDGAKREELASPPEYRDVVLSYPYGDIGAIGARSLEIAREYGYPCAVSNDPDYSPHRGRYFLQRLSLSDNKYELHMILSGLKYFIKYRRLLPTAERKN